MCQMMKAVLIAILCLTVLLSLQSGLEASEPAWKIVPLNGDTLDDCRQLAVTDSLLAFHLRGLAGSIPLDSVASLVRKNESRLLAGTGIGLAAGALMGAALGGAMYPGKAGGGMENIGQAMGAMGVFAICSMAGTLAGGVTGGLAGIDYKYPLADSTRESKVRTIRRAIREGSQSKEILEAERRRKYMEEHKAEISKQLEKSKMIGTEPEPAEMAKAEYPETAREAGVSGKVFVKVVVGPDGVPRSAEVLKGIGSGCDQAAREAAMRSKFRPGTVHGEPAEKAIVVFFTFP